MVKTSFMAAGLIVLIALLMVPAFSQEPAFSTTGPTPPPGVVSEPVSGSKGVKTIAGVPPYLWRHGCGPTAVGMVVGYWDGQGLDDLIPGDAATQTPEVQQAIASGGTNASPMTPEQHYEDYARPEDGSGPLLEDNYITASRTPHADNCIADFMNTSRSSDPYYMRYGWSWSTYVISSFTSYVAMKSPDYEAAGTRYDFSSGTLTFDVLKTEIDNNRPMVFLVDSSGDGATDHFITAIGYNDGPPQQYIYFDTWDLNVHQAEFREMSDQYSWGVMIAWAFSIEKVNVFRLTQTPHGDRYEEGTPLSLSVVVAGATGQVSYQWSKDGMDLPGETSASFEIDALTELDEGWYQCRVTDESKALLESPPAFIGVYPAGSMPAAGSAGMLLMFFACCWMGTMHLRRCVRCKKE